VFSWSYGWFFQGSSSQILLCLWNNNRITSNLNFFEPKQSTLCLFDDLNSQSKKNVLVFCTAFHVHKQIIFLSHIFGIGENDSEIDFLSRVKNEFFTRTSKNLISRTFIIYNLYRRFGLNNWRCWNVKIQQIFSMKNVLNERKNFGGSKQKSNYRIVIFT
jgi:hypothetical protein